LKSPAQASANHDAFRDGQIYCCGERQVFLIDAEPARSDPAARLWSWRAEDSSEIAAEHKNWYFSMDECKPVMGGRAVLACSSWLGGVVLIRRADRKCLFYAAGTNAHSADLVGDDLLAAAFSAGCDRLRLYRLDGAAMPGEPAWEMELPGGHGAVWDRARSVLWALGNSELLKLRIIRDGSDVAAEVLARFRLPHDSGHDLYPLDGSRLAVTVNTGVWQFDADAEKLTPLPPLETALHVKSLCRRADGTTIYTQGEPIVTRNISFIGAEPIVLPPFGLYKVRWNAPSALGR